MDKEMLELLNQIGAMGIWGIVIYKVLDFAQLIGAFLVIGYGIKKAWPHIRESF